MKTKGIIIIGFFIFLSMFYVNISEAFEINSATFTPGYDLSLGIKNANELKLDTVNVSITVDIKNTSSSNMSISEDEKLKFVKTLKELDRLNKNIIVEPFPWINEGVSTEVEYNPQNVEAFFESWNRILEEIIALSTDYNVTGILVENNFCSLYNYVDQWTYTINHVKELTDADILFKINWWYNADFDEKSFDFYNNLFELDYLRLVDYISLVSYFELVDKPTNSVEALKESWMVSTRYNREQPIFKQIKKLSEFYDKPIFFGELGYTYFKGTTMEPWDYDICTVVDENEQYAAYKAFFEIFSDCDFVAGYSLFQIGREDSKYYFMDMKSESIIKEYIQ